MKTNIILSFLILFAFNVFSQNITNTIGTAGLFTVKDASTNYLTLNQSTGQVNILKTLRLENTTSSTVGVIYKGVDSFLHNYGIGNTFLGSNSGNFTMTGASNSAFGYQSLSENTTGYFNSAFGVQSLYSNTTGYNNSAFGFYSLVNNTTGYQNSAFGNFSLNHNTTGNQNSTFGYFSLNSNTTGTGNSAFGYYSLNSNTTATGNSAFGYYSLDLNTTGIQNSAFGYFSLANSTTGLNNSAFGNQSLYSNTSGFSNSAFGDGSLSSNTTGTNNTALGWSTGSSITTGSNNTAIGYNAEVPGGTASNQVRIGNTFVTYAGVQVAWTITSDRRLKQNILNSNLGLGFISKLNPVSYIRINDEKQKTEYGLIAQEVEEVLKDEGIENPGMLTITDEGMYEMRYNDLLAPMIKAIQELKTQNDGLKTACLKVSQENNELKERLSRLEEMQSIIALEITKMKSNISETVTETSYNK